MAELKAHKRKSQIAGSGRRMQVRVKICGMNSVETLEAAISAGADMAGFVFFARSPRHLSLEAARALGERAQGRIKKVALTVDAADDAIASIIEHLNPDLLQLHGCEAAGRIAAIQRRFGLPVMKVFGVSARSDVAAALQEGAGADSLLLDAKPPKDATRPGGNGFAFDWSVLEAVSITKPWMLSGGLTPDNVAAAIAVTAAPGVDVSSGVESAPGVKDAAKIAAFIARARAAA